MIGATLAKDGQPATAWRGFAGEGLPPQVPQNAYEPGMTTSQLATDARDAAPSSSRARRTRVRAASTSSRCYRASGSKVVLPLPSGQNDWNSSISGRIGGPGVYVAYADGKAARLYRYGAGSKTLGRGAFASAAACPGPDGRLWVAWGGSTTGCS